MMRRLGLVLILWTLASCGGTPTTVPTTVTLSTPTATLLLAATPLAGTDTPTPTPTPGSADVHPGEGADKWYPGDPGRLRAAVEAYVDQAEVEPIPGRLLAIIVPHAGYIYSGPVAGFSFRTLQEADCTGRTIAVIGDTHTGNGSAEIAVWARGEFQTPLGSIPVDEKVAQAVIDASSGRIEFDREAFRSEHPVENQLPFIQVVCPGARIVPVVIRQPSMQNAQILANALAIAFGNQEAAGEALIVASTDLSHYHPYDEARKMDEVALQSIVSLDLQAIADSPRRCAELGLGSGDPTTMCSQGAVMAAVSTSRQMGADRATVLDYANSGDVPVGERDQVVGYGAVALWKSSSGGTQEGQLAGPSIGYQLPADPEVATDAIPLAPEEQEQLLILARETIAQFLTSETFPDFHSEDPALQQPMGAYVTYKKDGDLRGCLGRLEGDRPVYLNVQYAAVMAALADPRFPGVTLEELKNLTLEITLLEPRRLAQNPEEIQIGRDGVMMRVGETQGALFLPQVPLEQGWDLEETLLNLCQKAGLPDDAWQRPDARFYLFEGQWFGEEK